MAELVHKNLIYAMKSIKSEGLIRQLADEGLRV